MVKLPEEVLDKLAVLEVDALTDALENPELRQNPAILARVRNFLKDNKLQTTPETPGVDNIKKVKIDIPSFDDDTDGIIVQ